MFQHTSPNCTKFGGGSENIHASQSYSPYDNSNNYSFASNILVVLMRLVHVSPSKDHRQNIKEMPVGVYHDDQTLLEETKGDHTT